VRTFRHTEERVDTEDAVADPELGYHRAHLGHLTGELAARDLALGPSQPVEETGDERLAGAVVGVGAVDCARANPDQQLVIRRNGTLDLLDSQDLGRPVPIADHGLDAPILAEVDRRVRFLLA
jgi:hypothetical protein